MRELDAKTLLHKIRDTNDLLMNSINNEYLHLLKYNTTRVVDLEVDTESEISNVSSTDDEQTRQTLSINEQFRLSVIRGMRVQDSDKERLKTMLKNKEKDGLWL